MTLTCFTAYDIRGRLGIDLDETIACRIGYAFAQVLGAGRVVLGRDNRATSAALAQAVAEGMMRAGVQVLDLGLCGTEEMYFATSFLGADGGICVTASHNPLDFNGMKLVQHGSSPLGAAALGAIRALAERPDPGPGVAGGRIVDAAGVRADYVAHVVGLVDVAVMRPLRVLVNCGNGAAGPTFDAIAAELALRAAPFTFARMLHEPDSRFPQGVPNPLLAENRPATAQAVRDAGADMGIAFDGDFDRCFFFDEAGAFVPGEYVVALLANLFVTREPAAVIVHDPRLVLAVQATVSAAGGRAIVARTGHGFFKQALRDTGAVYGGEMSAHHYFRDFHACDSGMIPWLFLAELMGRSGQSLSELVATMRLAFPSSGEINFRVADIARAIARVEQGYAHLATGRDDTDGLSLDFGTWRLNLRASNTEPLLRLNVEARRHQHLVDVAVTEISALLAD